MPEMTRDTPGYSETTIETMAFDFFHAFERLIAYAGESTSKN
jgi:hypothetical protein